MGAGTIIFGCCRPHLNFPKLESYRRMMYLSLKRRELKMKEKGVNLILMGFGNVGRAFFQMLEEKALHIQQRYGLLLEIKAIFKSGGGVFSASGIRQGDIREALESGLSGHPLWKPGLSLEVVLKDSERGVLVECTPSNFETGEPGLRHIRLALDNSWNVATANKGPLAVDWRGLQEKAERNGLALKFSGATAAALPALDVGLHSLAGTRIQAIEGILNGTTNFILTRMSQGISYAEALSEAQAKGIAEHDPSLDVGGWDTAVKLLLIANATMGHNLGLKDVAIEGITDIPHHLLERAKKGRMALKLLGRARYEEGRLKAEVAPALLDRSHPLFGVDGTNKGITFITDSMGAITVTGGKSDPRGAAAALLKDIINIYRDRFFC